MINISSKNFRLDNIEAIIFDKDGTLTDSSIYWSEIIKRRSKKIQEDLLLSKEEYYELLKVMGLDITANKLLPEGPIAIKSRKEVIDVIISHLKKKDFKVNTDYIEELFKEVHKDFSKDANKYISPISSAFRLVQHLKKVNIKLILLTSDTKFNADETIRILELNNHFDLIIGGDSGFGDKKSGESCKQICQKLNLKNDNVICIGDAPVDNEMAINGKLKASILVESGQIGIEILSKFSRYCISDLSEIIIETNN